MEGSAKIENDDSNLSDSEKEALLNVNRCIFSLLVKAHLTTGLDLFSA